MLPDVETIPPPSDEDFTGTEDSWEVVETTSTAVETFERTLRRRTAPSADPEVLHGELIDPDRYFGKQGLLHASLRTDVAELGPLATGPGRTIWHYHRGVWLSGGDDEIRRRCRNLLGQRWRRSHVDGIVTDLAAQGPSQDNSRRVVWADGDERGCVA